MKSRSLLRAAAMVLPAALLLSACSEQTAATSEDEAAALEIPGNFTGDATIPAAVEDGLDVALVTRITTGSWYETYVAELESEVEGLGGTLQILDSNDDLAKMASNVDTAVNSQADVILINNGTAEALDDSVQKALDAGIVVATYDSDISLEGVSSIDQDDAALATNGLQALATDFDDEAGVIVLSVAGYAPLDRRLAAVDEFVAEHPGIEIVTQTGTVSGSAALDTAAQVAALLTANPEGGDVNAIWSHWNEFTRGAFTALSDAGRTDVAVYTVDLTDQELPYFWDESVDFRAASATNPATIGRSQVRLAWAKAAGEQDGNLLVTPTIVTKSDLPDEEISYAELAEYVPAWSADETTWPAWIKSLHERNAK
jgi:simple sugar transport system substrate-binding protein